MSIVTIYKHDRLAMVATIVFVSLALAIAYQPVIFNFFYSDDFYIICWLNQCKQNILLLFKLYMRGLLIIVLCSMFCYLLNIYCADQIALCSDF